MEGEKKKRGKARRRLQRTSSKTDAFFCSLDEKRKKESKSGEERRW